MVTNTPKIGHCGRDFKGRGLHQVPSMIRKSGRRFSEKIMLKQKDNPRVCFNSS